MVYMDYNATTPLDPSVCQSIQRVLEEHWANPSSSYEIGASCKGVIEDARYSIAEMIGANATDIIITSGGTESNHMVFHSMIEHYLTVLSSQETNGTSEPAHIHVISTNIEHDSVSLPLKHWTKRNCIEVSFVPVNRETGQVEVEDVINEIKPTTRLISVMLANNETGIIQPVAKIGHSLKKINRERHERIFLHTDAAQGLGKIPVDVEDLAVDYLTIVGHKFYGPRIGAIFIRDLEKNLTPYYPVFFGGGQERNLRPGTENTAMIVGLGKASSLVTEHLDEYAQHMKTIRDYLETSLLKCFGDKVVFNKASNTVDRLPNTCSVAFIGSSLKGSEILLKVPDIQASTGSACHSGSKQTASAVLLASGVGEQMAKSTLRLSVGRETTKADIDLVVKLLRKALL